MRPPTGSERRKTKPAPRRFPINSSAHTRWLDKAYNCLWFRSLTHGSITLPTSRPISHPLVIAVEKNAHLRCDPLITDASFDLRGIYRRGNLLIGQSSTHQLANQRHEPAGPFLGLRSALWRRGGYSKFSDLRRETASSVRWNNGPSLRRKARSVATDQLLPC